SAEAVNRRIEPEYLVLLGVPVTAAVAAKGFTSAKVANGTLTKPPFNPDAVPADKRSKRGSARALREIVANDKGELDLLDFQYALFNLLRLTFFGVQFLTRPDLGL